NAFSRANRFSGTPLVSGSGGRNSHPRSRNDTGFRLFVRGFIPHGARSRSDSFPHGAPLRGSADHRHSSRYPVSDSREILREKLCSLGHFIQERVLSDRSGKSSEALASVAHQSQADTIYEIDKFADAAILEWFDREWPENEPVEIVMEGLDEERC